MTITAVVGAQYGFEGKGNIVAALAQEYSVHARAGEPGVWHTVQYQGKSYGMHAIPSGWINTETDLLIGPGAILDLAQLKTEMRTLKRIGASVEDRLFIDRNCSIAPLGAGVSRVERIERGAHVLASDCSELAKYVCDTSVLLDSHVSQDTEVLLEASHGAGLSLTHGDWPHVASADTTVSQLFSDVGLAPVYLDECILVARTYPVRVPGNSGPLVHEVEWKEMGEKMHRPVTEKDPETGKAMRIGRWDQSLFEKACRLNKPTQIALNFLDYVSPDDRGIEKWEDLTLVGQSFVRYVEDLAGCPITMIGTGGPEFQVIRR